MKMKNNASGDTSDIFGVGVMVELNINNDSCIGIVDMCAHGREHWYVYTSISIWWGWLDRVVSIIVALEGWIHIFVELVW